VEPTRTSTRTDDWRRTALWLAAGLASATLILRLALGSKSAEAVATALLSGVVVFMLAAVAHRRS
jgi:hypothetical protein